MKNIVIQSVWLFIFDILPLIYKILQKVGVKQDKLEDVYKKLISKNVYYDLLNKGKINPDDDNLIVKYDSYSPDDLFKKRK